MSQSISQQSIVLAIKDQATCDLQGEAVILHIDSGVYYGLNSVGAYIWSLIQQPRSVQEVLRIVKNEYEVDPQRCESEVMSLLQELLEAGLIYVEAATSA